MLKTFKDTQETIQNVLTIALEIAGSKSNLSRCLDVRTGTVISWYKGQTPSLENLKKLSNFTSKKIEI